MDERQARALREGATMTVLVSDETRTWLSGIQTEIGAMKSMKAGTDAEIWNNAMDRARSIIDSYKEGRGLFQDGPRYVKTIEAGS